MTEGALGKTYSSGELIVRQGDEGNCMYVVQAGELEVVREEHDGNVRVALMNAGDIFGEMSIFERELRSATVRALGEARVLSVDKKTFLRPWRCFLISLISLISFSTLAISPLRNSLRRF